MIDVTCWRRWCGGLGWVVPKQPLLGQAPSGWVTLPPVKQPWDEAWPSKALMPQPVLPYWNFWGPVLIQDVSFWPSGLSWTPFCCHKWWLSASLSRPASLKEKTDKQQPTHPYNNITTSHLPHPGCWMFISVYPAAVEATPVPQPQS